MLKWFGRKPPAEGGEFPAAWVDILVRNVPYYRALPADQQASFREITQVLLTEKNWEGCRGFTLNDEIRVTIAGHAACLLLGNPDGYFPRLKTVLVYPSMFLVHDDHHGPGGIVSEDPVEHAGQSWDVGVVVLAWNEVQQSTEHSDDAYNVVLHEFAHQLDAAAAYTDGVPPLEDRSLRTRWADVMQRHYDQLARDYERGRDTLLDPYGLEAPAEFFAVATETFFETPKALQEEHPELYRLLRDYYRQDPAALG